MGGSRAGGAGGDGALVLDPNIGRRVSVMYPSHGGWYGGIITDYNGLTKEHWCARGAHEHCQSLWQAFSPR